MFKDRSTDRTIYVTEYLAQAIERATRSKKTPVQAALMDKLLPPVRADATTPGVLNNEFTDEELRDFVSWLAYIAGRPD